MNKTCHGTAGGGMPWKLWLIVFVLQYFQNSVDAFTSHSIKRGKWPLAPKVSSSSTLPCLYATKPKPSETPKSSDTPKSSEKVKTKETAESNKPKFLEALTGETTQTNLTLTPPPPTAESLYPTKLRQLKDRMWIRDTLEDLTSAEFATSLVESKRKSVDFEALLNKLDERVEEMCVSDSMGACRTARESPEIPAEDVVTFEEKCFLLTEGMGMGSVVYTTEQREALLQRIIATRNLVLEAKKARDESGVPAITGDLNEIRSRLQDSLVEDGSSVKNFTVNLYVREDGTVDWDGALQDRDALKQFGEAVWSRINGVAPEEVGEEGAVAMEKHGGEKVTAKIVETPALKEMKERLDALTKELQEMEAEHNKLLNSAVSEGSAIANVNFAKIDKSLRAQIRSSTASLKSKTSEVTIQSLNYELERIFTYLEGEMGNTFSKGYIPLQDRLNVAEFGLLESQIASINEQKTTVDRDMLAVVNDQLVDFKRRLGIDYYVTGITYDSDAVMRWIGDLWVKTKEGVAFYAKGCQLLWNDLVFSTYLFGRALQGYTLKPREVRTLRRTFRDVITFIPVVIILIIPLTPIGHVLVFGAIQRFFPDFFPSCFTERRQNLLELYQTTEYSEISINETWKQKIVRMSEAIVFLTVDLVRKAVRSITATPETSDTDLIEKDANITNGVTKN